MITHSEPKLPGWTTFSLKEFDKDFKCCKSVLMGDFLIILAHDESLDPNGPELNDPSSTVAYSEPENPEPAVLFAIDLRDGRIQEVKMESLAYHENYTFTKYKDNQIIKLGGDNSIQGCMRDIYQITIESFNPLKVVCKKIDVKAGKLKPEFSGHTAQIYKDALYVFELDNWNEKSSPVWKFDLIELEWEHLKPAGERPGQFFGASSCFIEDRIYIYGGTSSNQIDNPTKNDIFVLNLESLTWTRLEQTPGIREQMDLDRLHIEGDLYKGNILTLKEDCDQIRCWNIEGNSWSTYNIQENEYAQKTGNLVVYKNLLIANVSIHDVLFLSIFDLNNIELPISESPEQKHIKSLFMSEKESDIQFKIQSRIIPAHKQVLTQKSKYFTNLFNSGMAESRQKIIEINDCEYPVFQEFLRFIYCDKIELNTNLAMKLLPFSDKYLQDDLNERCMSHLTYNINSDNVYEILGFAIQQGLSLLVTWCLNFFKMELHPENVSKLMEFIDTQTNPESAKDILELRKKAVEVITNGYMEISKQHLSFFMDFLMRSVEMGTLRSLIKFIWGGADAKSFSKKDISREDDDLSKTSFEKETINLRKNICSFAQENFTDLKINDILDDLPKHFWLDFASSFLENPDKSGLQSHRANNKEEEETKENSKSKIDEEKDAKGRKRMEPVETEEAKPELKKTKK